MLKCNVLEIDGEKYLIGKDALINLNRPQEVISLFDDEGDALTPEDALSKVWCEEVDARSMRSADMEALEFGAVI